ncbi:MAG: OsmC family protein [Woeseiaceae bacterium]|jgi:putative redox protein
MPRITAELSDGMVVRISNGRHEWSADEPVTAGGTDTGPNPYELLLGSLAACTCTTVSAYCKHKGLKLTSITTSYHFKRIHADDCADCDKKDTGMIDHITSDVHIEGDFDEAQRERLAFIASRCPVHKTLTNGVRIKDNATFG